LNRPESRVRTSAVSLLDLREHVVDIARGVIVSCRRSDHFELLPYSTGRFTSACQFQSPPDPLRDRHTASARDALNFPVLGIFQNYLQSFSHYRESI
jgi:hypothetical protein